MRKEKLESHIIFKDIRRSSSLERIRTSLLLSNQEKEHSINLLSIAFNNLKEKLKRESAPLTMNNFDDFIDKMIFISTIKMSEMTYLTQK